MDSYGKDQILSWNEQTQKVEKLAGYVLYQGKMTLWNGWKKELKRLLQCKPGKDRLEHWNSIFSAQETQDQNEAIEMVLYLPYGQTF